MWSRVFDRRCGLVYMADKGKGGFVAWRSGNAFHPISKVTLRRVGLVL